MNQQPEALRLADLIYEKPDSDGHCIEAAKELRRLHAENEALRKQLKHAELAASAEASIVDELQAELQEQARVNGIGSERELKLMAENEALRKDAERWRFAMNDGAYALCKMVRVGRDFEWAQVTLAKFDAAMKGQS